MIRKHKQRADNAHYCLLVNRKASRYDAKVIERTIKVIKSKNRRYTVLEPKSAMDLVNEARLVTMPVRTGEQSKHQAVIRRGKVTGLIACGGDGTFNLVARAALEANIPLGILPMGRFNNIARHLCSSLDFEAGVNKILEGKYRKIDAATADTQLFFGSVGLGFVPRLAMMLEGRKRPRFGLGWSQLAAKAAAEVEPIKTIIKIDAYRFELTPLIISVNLLPYTVGLPLSPVSLDNDGRAEVILDHGEAMGEFSGYIRQVHKNKFHYDDMVRLYRGEVISIQSTRGRMLYLDGELIKAPGQSIDIKISDKKLKVFC